MKIFVELTMEKIKLLKARYLITKKQENNGGNDNDLSLITSIDIQSINHKLEAISQEERKIEGRLL
jgi:hypothetical protein